MNTLAPFATAFVLSRHRQGRYNRKSVQVVGPRLRTLAEHFGQRPLDRLSRRAVEAWLESLQRLAPNSRASYLASVRQFTAWLVTEGHLTADPCVSVARVKRARSVPRAQSQAAVAATLAACRDDRDRAIVWLMVGIGLRRIEVAGLRWEHYDEHTRTLLVKGKGSHERLLPIPVEVGRALDGVRDRGNTGPIVCSHLVPGASIQPATVGAIAGRILRDAGVKHAPYDGVSGHALRHTSASDVLDRCGDLRVVQAMLGHEHLTSTAIYLRRAHVSQLRSAMEGRTYEEAA